MNEKARVLDSPAIINMRGRIEGMFFTVSGVIGELRDLQSRSMADSMIAEGRLTLREPSKSALGDIDKFVREKNMQDLLSETDIKVLALALELKAPVVTDDYDVQNCCKLLGIDFERVSKVGIRKAYAWRRVCRGCGMGCDAEFCEVCGSGTKTER